MQELDFIQAGVLFGGKIYMACKGCGSESLMNLKGEITASFPLIEDAKTAPIYFAQEMWVCINCGFAEVRLPAAQLEVLRQRKNVAS
jgi:hypothetical protein